MGLEYAFKPLIFNYSGKTSALRDRPSVDHFKVHGHIPLGTVCNVAPYSVNRSACIVHQSDAVRGQPPRRYDLDFAVSCLVKTPSDLADQVRRDAAALSGCIEPYA